MNWSIRNWVKRGVIGLLCMVVTMSSAAMFTAGEADAKDSYSNFEKITTKGPKIPGLTSDWVPQGMAVVPSKDWVIIAHYWDNKSRPSAISINSMKTKKRIKTLYLYENSKTKHTGHVGGLAVSKSHLWVASGKSVYRIPLSTLSSKSDYQNVVMKKYGLGVQASYATYSDGVLWVGEYTDGTDANKKGCKGGPKGKIRGYKLTSKDDLPSSKKPVYTWKTPDRIQGAAFTKERVIYSQSCGRSNSSELLVYKRGTNGKQVGSGITMPPLSQNIQIVGKKLYINFESGAKKFKKGVVHPLYHVHLMNIKL